MNNEEIKELVLSYIIDNETKQVTPAKVREILLALLEIFGTQETAFSNHITDDAGRWQQIGDAMAAMYGEMVKIAKQVYEGATPEMDTDNPISVYGGKGLLTLSGSGQWEVPQNGYIVVIYQAILGVAPILMKNGDAVDYGGLSVLGSGTPSAPIQVNSGDVITATGNLGLGASFNVTFYPNK